MHVPPCTAMQRRLRISAAGRRAAADHTLKRNGRSVPNLCCTIEPRASGCASIQLLSVEPSLSSAGPLGWVPTLQWRIKARSDRGVPPASGHRQAGLMRLCPTPPPGRAPRGRPAHQSSANGLPSSTLDPFALASLATWRARRRAEVQLLACRRSERQRHRKSRHYLAAGGGPAPGVVLRGAPKRQHLVDLSAGAAGAAAIR